MLDDGLSPIVDDGKKVVAGGHWVSIGCGYGYEGCWTGTTFVSRQTLAQLIFTYFDLRWDLGWSPVRSRHESHNWGSVQQMMQRGMVAGILQPCLQTSIGVVVVKMLLASMAALVSYPWLT